MKRLGLLGLVLVIAGCGGGGAKSVVVTVRDKSVLTVQAFEIPWPHGSSEADASVQITGKLDRVVLGGVTLAAGKWTCVRSGNEGGPTGARYELAGESVTVILDWSKGHCHGGVPIPFVGGYGSGGGYVGEWTAGAVVTR